MDKRIQSVRNKFVNFLSNEVSAERIYFMSFIIFFVSSFLQTSTYRYFFTMHVLNYLQYLAILLLVFKILFFQKYNWRQVVFSFFLLFISVVAVMQSKSPIPCYFSLFVIASHNINPDKIIRWYFIFGSIILIFVIISSLTGLITNLTYTRGNFIRRSFGIIYPTDFAAHVFYLILAYCYLYFQKIKFKNYLGFFLIALFVYYFTNARLDVLCILLVIPTMVFIKSGAVSYHFKKVIWMLPAIFALFTVMITFLYKYNFKFLNLLDKVLSHRLTLGSEGFSRFGLPLLGTHVVEKGWGGSLGMKASSHLGLDFHYFMLDSSYIRILIMYGLVFFVTLIVLISVYSFYDVRKKSYIMPAIFMLIALSSIVEQHMLEIAYNPFFLVLFSVLDNKLKVSGQNGANI